MMNASTTLIRRHPLKTFLGRRFLSTTKTRQRFTCLDLRQSGLSVIERLCLEECLLRHDNRQWIIWGTHDPMQSRYLKLPPGTLPSYIDQAKTQPENPCIVVMGIGGKPQLLLDIPRIQDHGIWVIKRFSGGGTVVVDGNCIYTTIIGRNGPGELVSSPATPSTPGNSTGTVPPYPREIMEWTATDVFGPTFARLKEMAVAASPSLSPLEFPDFALKENDYVLGETQKVAGNAQSIVKTGFLHHTTFLWSYSQENMKYLTLPAKRPDYRKDRSHSSFLIQLQDAYHNQLEMDAFFESIQSVCEESFDVETVSLDDALRIVADVGEGNIQTFFETKSRTRFLDLP